MYVFGMLSIELNEWTACHIWEWFVIVFGVCASYPSRREFKSLVCIMYISYLLTLVVNNLVIQKDLITMTNNPEHFGIECIIGANVAAFFLWFANNGMSSSTELSYIGWEPLCAFASWTSKDNQAATLLIVNEYISQYQW